MDFDYDAIDAGIEPGGLRSRSNVRLLICYIMNSVNKPIKKDFIISAMQKNGIANYFEILEAFNDLHKKQNIVRTDSENDLFTVTKSGKLIAGNLSDDLPKSIRERAMASVTEPLMQERNETENVSEIKKLQNGYMVDCLHDFQFLYCAVLVLLSHKNTPHKLDNEIFHISLSPLWG
ncbi:MAG: DUF4364 family protein, partial [Clostridia bacterium]|nr:DUF4364 family protein [Clostridia bacterium]